MNILDDIFGGVNGVGFEDLKNHVRCEVQRIVEEAIWSGVVRKHEDGKWYYCKMKRERGRPRIVTTRMKEEIIRRVSDGEYGVRELCKMCSDLGSKSSIRRAIGELVSENSLVSNFIGRGYKSGLRASGV